MINPKTKTVRLTDYGISNYGLPGGYVKDEAGTPYYMPPKKITRFTNEQADAIALMRCIYLPNHLEIYRHGHILIPSSIPRLLSDSVSRKLNLQTYLNTSGLKMPHHSPLYIGALLILASNGNQRLYRLVGDDENLQKSLHVLYFSKTATKNSTAELCSSSMKSHLAGLWPLVDKVPSQFIKAALSDVNIFKLLIDFQKHTPNNQFKYSKIFSDYKAIDVIDINSLNALRENLRLNVVSRYHSEELSKPIKLPVISQTTSQDPPSSKKVAGRGRFEIEGEYAKNYKTIDRASPRPNKLQQHGKSNVRMVPAAPSILPPIIGLTPKPQVKPSHKAYNYASPKPFLKPIDNRRSNFRFYKPGNPRVGDPGEAKPCGSRFGTSNSVYGNFYNR
jgi:hypothetical protein